jgi:hypothetical protein
MATAIRHCEEAFAKVGTKILPEDAAEVVSFSLPPADETNP